MAVRHRRLLAAGSPASTTPPYALSLSSSFSLSWLQPSRVAAASREAAATNASHRRHSFGSRRPWWRGMGSWHLQSHSLSPSSSDWGTGSSSPTLGLGFGELGRCRRRSSSPPVRRLTSSPPMPAVETAPSCSLLGCGGRLVMFVMWYCAVSYLWGDDGAYLRYDIIYRTDGDACVMFTDKDSYTYIGLG